MSAPPRSARGGGAYRGRPSTSTPARNRGRGMAHARGGRSRGAAGHPKAEGLLQDLQAGTLNKSPGASRRGPSRPPASGQQGSTSHFQSSKSFPPPSQRDHMNHMTAKFQLLKTKREAERAKAIKDGFLADPEKKTSLDKAITPVGTCTEMCPEFERVERVVQNMVDKTEKVSNDETGRDVASEERMIKRFRRSAAGYDEQLPSDIRTPETLQTTLNYLLDNVIGGEERLATVHKFVWDRTRGIRNDFSIQQVTKDGDVRIAVDCFERIARFHILSLHQLSNPENLVGEHFDPHQEREQLNNTLLSLMYYYDDHRSRQRFSNEAEFRAYCIILELQSQQPDLEDRMQSWPQQLLADPRIRIAFDLYSAAGNTLYDQGPLKPQAAFDIAQGNAIRFWQRLKSKASSYLLACVAEIYFGQIRFVALQGLWKSTKRAPASMQVKIQDWTLEELTKLLGFDDDHQALEFCEEYGLGFKHNDAGSRYLDFTSQTEMTLDKSSTPNRQVFSVGIVEEKRYHRTLVTVINGVGVAQAIQEGLIVAGNGIGNPEDEDESEANDESSLFIPETRKDGGNVYHRNQFLPLNPQASTFTPNASSSPSLLFPSTSPAHVNSTEFSSNRAPASALPSRAASDPSITSVFGNTAPFKNPFGPLSTTSPTSSSSFTSSPSQVPPASGSFGLPSFPANAPASSALSTVASLSNNAWPPAVANGDVKVDNPGDPPELIPAQELDTKPLAWPPPMPLTDQTNAQHEKPNAETTLPDKPPASPRPGFKALPATTNMEAAKPMFPELSPINNQTPSAAQNNDSVSRSAASAASFVTSQTPNAAREAFPESISAPLKSISNFTDKHTDNENIQDRTSSSSLLSSPLTPKIDSTSKQSVPPKTKSIPAISTNKSAIPPTLTPNASPSFTTSANTKPKHKSPLGSQPPIFAVESSAKSTSPQKSVADLDKAAHNVAEIGFLEPHGILQQYIEHTATALIQDALRQFEREAPLRAAHSARHHLLSKKYFGRWKSIYWRRKLNRNATSRRELLSQSIRKESQRKARGDAELEAILEAQRQRDRIQAEQLRRSHTSPSPRIVVSDTRNNSKTTATGHKRKSLHGDEADPIMNGNSPRKIAKGQGHRRSKTMGGTSATSRNNSVGKPISSPSSSGLSSSVLSGRSILLDRSARSGLLHSTNGRKTDSTKTDYFRLKAFGIDPDTPLFPDTKSSLERKRRRQEEMSHLTPRKRASTLSSINDHSLPQEKALAATNSQARNISAPEQPITKSTSTRPGNTPQVLEDDDDFLRQIREVQAAMSEDAEWFRAKAAEIEKEVEQQEEMKKSASQRSSTNSSTVGLVNSNTGLARVNGYEYAPAISKTGSQHSLSRTEQRIRATGAHGLATKPVSDYLPVALSKATRASLINNGVPRRSKKRKGKTKQGENDSKYICESDETDEGEATDVEMSHAMRKRVRHAKYKHRITVSNHLTEPEDEDRGSNIGGRPVFGLARHTNADHDGLSGQLDDLYDEAEEDGGLQEEYGYSSSDEMNRADEDEDEDQGEDGNDVQVEYDESLDHVGSEHVSNANSILSANLRGGHGGPGRSRDRRANPFHMRLRSATPEAAPHPHPSESPGPGPGYDHQAVGGVQMSRATSGTGTGVSVDDALVLSD